jgi:N-acetylglucosaminyldiphosphoundecaprenol N-acetyl-beta-D-mannosaminyltransferase
LERPASGVASLAKRRVRLLGLELANVSLDEAVRLVFERARSSAPTRICFVNAHCMNIAAVDPEYREVLATSELVFADGVGMRLAGRLLGDPIADNVNGTDMFPALCAALAGSELSIFLLGARPGVAEQVGDWVAANHPGVTVAGCLPGYFGEHQIAQVVATIRASGASILLVAMGVPQQELWIRDHQAECGVPVALGVGGLFDFYSGRVRRAPVWMRRCGLEWAFRLLQEPGRLWRRYLVGNWLFVGRVLLERFGSSRPS